jgi:polyisoprenoid-binding protein YceI
MITNKSKIPRLGIVAVVCCVSISGIASSALSRPYRLSDKAKNRVEFHSKATLESFSGKSKSITAEFDVEPAKLSSTKGKVTVDLRSLDTGIDLRNKHMRDNHLHTDSFPNAIFQVDSLLMNEGVPSATDSVTIHGEMTIHGISRPMSAQGVITGRTGSEATGALRIQSEFPLKVTDFGVPRPEFLFLKLAEEVKIVVDLTLEPEVE